MRNFPKRPASHVIGEQAIDIFKSACDPNWVTSIFQPDYGLDIKIEYVQDECVTGEECYVQVKGHKTIKGPISQASTVSIEQSTINYWLGKLNPVLIVLVDVSREVFWYAWLEYAYKNYPRPMATKGRVSLKLDHNSRTHRLTDDVPRYLAIYFSQLRSDFDKLFDRMQLNRMLFHVTKLFRICARMVIFLQQDTKNRSDDEIIEYWQMFYREFASHDLSLRVPWHTYAHRSLARARPIVDALESRFTAYERIRSTFFRQEEATESLPPDVPVIGLIPTVPTNMKLCYVRLRYPELLENILPTMNVLQDIEDFLFQILLLGRVRFKEE